jgi:nucleotidyltransferase substrate binding protein (TIGR01987 family)
MSKSDISWIGRFEYFSKTLGQLKEAIDITEHRELSRLEELGVLLMFENTLNLACNSLQDYLQLGGKIGIYGPRDVARKSFEQGLIKDQTIWLDMINSRNEATEEYNANTIALTVQKVVNSYYNEFYKLLLKLSELT